MAINDVAGERDIIYMYGIFFVNFWVIIFCVPPSYIKTLKPKNLKKNLKTYKPKNIKPVSKNLGFLQPLFSTTEPLIYLIMAGVRSESWELHVWKKTTKI